MDTTRRYSLFDRLLIEADTALRTVHGSARAERASPGGDRGADTELSSAQRDMSARLMRINHAGEVAAQGLYRGQALTARDARIRDQMEASAKEETDHLAWCEQRIDELGTHRSVLGPIWYCGSYAIGALAGLAGDRWSLGFVNETEKQVEQHLADHLDHLPPEDQRTRAVLEQIQSDEVHHAKVASQAGAAELPGAIKSVMTMVSKVMTRTAYWV